MARKLLGNIKGESGTLTHENIGVTNILDLSDLETYDLASNIDNVDLENGIINYSGMAYYMRNTKTLKKGVHTFRVKDYTIHGDSFGGRIRFQVRHYDDSTSLFSVDVEKETPYSFNIDEEKEYYLEIRVSGVTRKNGFIEKPMLVEGDYPVMFNPSYEDKSVLIKQKHVTGRFYLTEINNDGSFENLSVYNLTPSEFMSVQDNGILFKEGLYLITNRTNLSQNDGVVTLNIRVNTVSVLVYEFMATSSGNFSHVLAISDGDVVDVRISYTGSTKGTMPVNSRNGFTINKLGGL